MKPEGEVRMDVFAKGVHECRYGRVHVPRTVTAEHLAKVLGKVAKEVGNGNCNEKQVGAA